MTAETLTHPTPDVTGTEATLEVPAVEVRREDFGPGRAGDWAYQTVAFGAPCVSYIDLNKTECGKLSIGTVDVDIRGDLDLFPYCSTEHAERLEIDLVEEITSQGRSTIPARNGFGRA